MRRRNLAVFVVICLSICFSFPKEWLCPAEPSAGGCLENGPNCGQSQNRSCNTLMEPGATDHCPCVERGCEVEEPANRFPVLFVSGGNPKFGGNQLVTISSQSTMGLNSMNKNNTSDNVSVPPFSITVRMTNLQPGTMIRNFEVVSGGFTIPSYNSAGLDGQATGINSYSLAVSEENGGWINPQNGTFGGTLVLSLTNNQFSATQPARIAIQFSGNLNVASMVGQFRINSQLWTKVPE